MKSKRVIADPAEFKKPAMRLAFRKLNVSCTDTIR